MANLNAKYSNKLINEDSPYLLQHAHNPVAWYPWGDEAFEKARKEDKLIFLSIGYSTCHWCHVMERESFENESVADILNKDFVAIKLDREEYPHIDRHYQEIYTLMNRRGGGWPLTIVMTPEAKTFFSATYLPPEDRYGRSGLKGILHMLDNAYKTRQEDVLKSVNSIESALRRMENSQQGKQVTLDMSIAQDFVKILASNFDQTYKGFGSAPKFPNATTLDVLLDVYRITDNETALNISTQTLLAMSNGGIYDQIEGGFYRYSVDEKWIIPHFEKMLYTNAELLEGYANAYALTKEPRFKEVIMQTVHNIHERFEKDAMYYSASDADSDANEGKYFVFDFKESFQDLIEGELSKENAKNILAYYSIDAEGNFEENKTNPHLSGLEIPHNLHKGTKILRANRAKKNYPFIDFKIQTSWNALYLRGLFKAAKYVDNTYAQTALSALDSLLNHLYIDGVLYHQVIVGKKPKVKAYLEDYAFLISVLVDAYQINFDESYITLANRFIEEAVMNFYKNGRWYMSNDDFKAGAEFYDASYRSALAVMIEALFQVAALSDNLKLDAFAKHSLEAELSALKVNPNQYPYGLKTYLQSQLSYVVIKSTKENLLANRDMLNNIRYPYILLKPSEDAKFLACKIESCFALDEKLTKVIDKIQKVMK